VLHPIGEVVTIAFCSMVCGYSHYTEMELFAESQAEWLGKFLVLANGTPSHDTFRNVFGGLCPVAFAEVLSGWSGAPAELAGEHVQVDGKAICGTGVHLVRAWVDGIGISAGQVACAEKSNEIEAIPRLLAALELRGSMVSIDAIGCQTAIASQIDAADARYMLALKGNQKEAHRSVVDHFEGGGGGAPARSEEFTRGRHEVRTCWVEDDLSFFGKSWKWDGLTCAAKVRSEVCRPGVRGTGGSEASCEDRYYLCSLPSAEASPEALLALARAHWSVENRCHWTLDVVFGEDACPVRDKTAARNLSTMRGMVMALLRDDPTKGSLKSKRQRAALDLKFRSKIISTLHA
jgi:predicted transposase YbfD/YdcC